MSSYILFNKSTKTGTYYEQLPTDWMNISGLKFLPDHKLIDLTWAGIEDLVWIPSTQIGQYVSGEKFDTLIKETHESKWIEVKMLRDRLLADSDWTQLPDSPLDDSKKLEWMAYRQSLRDLPTQQDPFNLVWFPRPR